MPNAVLTPTVATTATKVGGKLYRKQVLPRDQAITYRDPATGADRTLVFDDTYLRAAVEAFNAGAYDAVKFQIADARNTHTEDPERARGTVRALELTADGLDMIVDLTDAGAQLIADNPDLPVSARIAEGLARADGKTFPVAIKHVLGTLDPKVPGMSPWQAVDLANDPDTTTVVDLTAEDYTPKEPVMPEEKPSFLAKIGKALGLTDTATEDEIVAKLTTPAAPVDEPQLTDDEVAALEALANEPQSVSLTADAQRQIDLANANAEQARNETAELRRNAQRSAWLAERTDRMHAGTPKAVLDLTAPWCGGDIPTGFVDLANTETTVEQVREAAADTLRKVIDTYGAIVDLSVIGEAPEPDEEAAAARAAQVKAHRQAAGI